MFWGAVLAGVASSVIGNAISGGQQQQQPSTNFAAQPREPRKRFMSLQDFATQLQRTGGFNAPYAGALREDPIVAAYLRPVQQFGGYA